MTAMLQGTADVALPRRQRFTAPLVTGGVAIALTLAAAACRPASPGLLVVTLDTTRADCLGTYGKANAGTPNLDRLAAGGTVFEHASTCVPVTLPSHTTIFTGLYPPAHGVRDNGLFSAPQSLTTLAEILADRGWATGAAVGAFPLTRQFGLDQGFEFFDDRLDEPPSGAGALPADVARALFFDERNAAKVNDAILPWLREIGDRPFFAWIHYWDPHHPHVPPPPYDVLYQTDLYQGEIAFTDAALGTVVRALEDIGRLESTLVVVVGDHGEGRGEHGEDTHSQLIYDSTLHVPLIVKGPGVPANRRVAEWVGTVDIVPTILELLEIQPTTTMHGRSLVGTWDDGAVPAAEPYYAETMSPKTAHDWSELRAWSVGPIKYIHGPYSELFDRSLDPKELTNLAAAKPGLAADYRRELEAALPGLAGSSAEDAVHDLDPDARARLEALGYISAGTSPTVVEERLSTGGVHPRDRVHEVNVVSLIKTEINRGAFLEARELAQDLVADDPDNGFYRGLLATSLLGLGQLEQAAGVVEGGPVGPHSDRIALEIGKRLFATGERSRGVSLARNVADRVPSTGALYLLGEMYRVEGSTDLAEQAFREALDLDPDHVPSSTSLAVDLAGAGRLEEAEGLLRRVVAVDPVDPRNSFNLATVLTELGRFEEAESLLATAVGIQPDYWKAHLALLGVRLRRGDVEGARAVAATLASRCPDRSVVDQARRLIEEAR